MTPTPETGSRLANIGGALLLGGTSTRMGQDKSRMPVEGLPAATRIAGLLAQLFDEVLLVGGAAPDAAPGRRVVDPEGPRCALRGVCAALEASASDRVLVVATDLPLLTPDLLLALVSWPEADAVVPRSDDGAHPLCALYRREPVARRARARLEAGDLAMRDLLGELDTSYLEPADLAAVDPTGWALTNVNTPEDLALAAARLRGARHPAAR